MKAGYALLLKLDPTSYHPPDTVSPLQIYDRINDIRNSFFKNYPSNGDIKILRKDTVNVLDSVWIRRVIDKGSSPLFLLLLAIIERSIPSDLLDNFNLTLTSKRLVKRHSDEMQKTTGKIYDEHKLNRPDTILAAFIVCIKLKRISSTYLFDILDRNIYKYIFTLDVFKELVTSFPEPKSINKIFKLSRMLAHTFFYSKAPLDFILDTFDNKNFPIQSSSKLLVNLLSNGFNNPNLIDILYDKILGNLNLALRILKLINRIKLTPKLNEILNQVVEFILANANNNLREDERFELFNEIRIGIKHHRLAVSLLKCISHLTNESFVSILENLFNSPFDWERYFLEIKQSYEIKLDERKEQYSAYLKYHQLPLTISSCKLIDYYTAATIPHNIRNFHSGHLELDLCGLNPDSIEEISCAIGAIESIKIKIYDHDAWLFLHHLKQCPNISSLDLILCKGYQEYYSQSMKAILEELVRTLGLKSFSIQNSEITPSELCSILSFSQEKLESISIFDECELAFCTSCSIPKLNTFFKISDFHFNYHMGLFTINNIIQFIQEAKSLNNLTLIPDVVLSDPSLANAITSSQSITKLKFNRVSKNDVAALIDFNQLMQLNEKISSYTIEFNERQKDDLLSNSLAALLTINKNISTLSISKVYLNKDFFRPDTLNALKFLSLTLDEKTLIEFTNHLKYYVHLSKLNITFHQDNLNFNDIVGLVKTLITHSNINHLKIIAKSENSLKPDINIPYWAIKEIGAKIERTCLFIFKTNIQYPFINRILVENIRSTFITPFHLIYYREAIENGNFEVIKNMSSELVKLKLASSVKKELKTIKKVIANIPYEVFLNIMSFLPLMNSKRVDHYTTNVLQKLERIIPRPN